jgi:hypothetical protein
VVDKAVVAKNWKYARGGGATTREELFVPAKLRADDALPKRATRKDAWAAHAQEFTNRSLPGRHHNSRRHICDHCSRHGARRTPTNAMVSCRGSAEYTATPIHAHDAIAVQECAAGSALHLDNPFAPRPPSRHRNPSLLLLKLNSTQKTTAGRRPRARGVVTAKRATANYFAPCALSRHLDHTSAPNRPSPTTSSTFPLSSAVLPRYQRYRPPKLPE